MPGECRDLQFSQISSQTLTIAFSGEVAAQNKPRAKRSVETGTSFTPVRGQSFTHYRGSKALLGAMPRLSEDLETRKLEAVQFALQAGANRRDVARRCGISARCLYKWMERYRRETAESVISVPRPHPAYRFLFPSRAVSQSIYRATALPVDAFPTETTRRWRSRPIMLNAE